MNQEIHKKRKEYQHKSFGQKIEPKRKVPGVSFKFQNKDIPDHGAHEKDNDFPQKDRIQFLVFEEIIPGLNIKEVKPNNGVKGVQEGPDQRNDQNEL